MRTPTKFHDKDGSSSPEQERGILRRRPRPAADLILDYKDIESLKPFITESGKIVPARMSRLSSQQQRELTRQIKRARQLALLPIAPTHGSQGYNSLMRSATNLA